MRCCTFCSLKLNCDAEYGQQWASFIKMMKWTHQWWLTSLQKCFPSRKFFMNMQIVWLIVRSSEYFTICSFTNCWLHWKILSLVSNPAQRQWHLLCHWASLTLRGVTAIHPFMNLYIDLEPFIDQSHTVTPECCFLLSEWHVSVNARAEQQDYVSVMASNAKIRQQLLLK